MKLSRSGSGGARVRLDTDEAETLTGLIGDLLDALQPGALAAADPVQQRLFPAGYQGDDRAAEAFRELTETGLREERVARAEACLAELAGAAPAKRRLVMTLDGESAQRWTQVLNDMRLAIGTRIGVTEDDDSYHDLDPADPKTLPYAVYAYLTGVQDSLVRVLMGAGGP